MVALFAMSFLLSVRRDRRSMVALHTVITAAALLGLVSISRVFGDFYDYVYRWVWMITVAAAAAIVTTAWRELQLVAPRDARWRRAQPVLLGLAVVAVLAAGVALTVNDATAEIPTQRDSRLVGGVTPAVAEQLDPAGRYLVRWHDPMSLGGVGYGVLLELERQGFTVGVDPWGSAAALPHRVMPEETATDVLWVVTGDRSIEDFGQRPDAIELGYYDQRTPEEQEESARLRAELEQRLTDIGRADLIAAIDTQYGLAPLVLDIGFVPDDVREIADEYDALREPIAVFVVPPGAPLYP